MPDVNTTVLGLIKVEVGGSVDQWGPKLNTNCDTLDALFTDPAKKLLPLAHGGTGADSATGARTALGLKSMALVDDADSDGAAHVRKSGAWATLVYGDIADAPTSFPPAAHTHPTSEVVGLDATLSGLAADVAAVESSLADKANTSALGIIAKREFSANSNVLIDDGNKLLALTGSNARTLTIQPDSTTNVPIGTRCDLTMEGTGVLSIAPGAGVSLSSLGNARKLAGQFAGATLYKYGANSWRLYGAITA